MDKFNNIEAEKVLINQMILDGSIIQNVYDVIKPDTFFSASYKACYEVLLTLARKCTPIDELSFRNECKNFLNLDIIDEVTNATFTSANWEYYANEIKTCYIARSLRAVLQTSLDRLKGNNGAEVANAVMSEVGKISANTTACVVHDINDLACQYLTNLDKAIKNKDEYTGYQTGLKNIDDITLGLQPEYIIIGARPSLGKTALGEQIALRTSGITGGNDPRKTLFVELEMSPKQLTERAIANITGVGINKLRTGLLDTVSLNKVMMACGKLAESSHFIPVTCDTRKLSDIVSCIRREVRINHIEIVFIDHIGLIHPEGKYSAAWEGVREISNTFQQLQRELGIPIVVLSQVGRGVEGKKPSLADLRGSGAIEEDADTVMLIDRDRQNDSSETKIAAEIQIVKNRNGACGTAKLYFLPQSVKFMDNFDKENDKDRGSAPDLNKKWRKADISQEVSEMFEDPAEAFLAGGTPANEIF